MGEGEKSAYWKKKSEDLENIRVTEQIALWLNRKENTLESLSEEHQEISHGISLVSVVWRAGFVDTIKKLCYNDLVADS